MKEVNSKSKESLFRRLIKNYRQMLGTETSLYVAAYCPILSS